MNTRYFSLYIVCCLSFSLISMNTSEQKGTTNISEYELYATFMYAIDNNDEQVIHTLIEKIDPHVRVKFQLAGKETEAPLFIYALTQIDTIHGKILEALSKKSATTCLSSHIHYLRGVYKIIKKSVEFKNDISENATKDELLKLNRAIIKGIKVFYYLLKELTIQNLASLDQDSCSVLVNSVTFIIFNYSTTFLAKLTSVKVLEDKNSEDKNPIFAKQASKLKKSHEALNTFYKVLEKLFELADDKGYNLLIVHEHYNLLSLTSIVYINLSLTTLLLKYYSYSDDYLKQVIEKIKHAVDRIDSKILDNLSLLCQNNNETENVTWCDKALRINYNQLKDNVVILINFMINRRGFAQIMPFEIAEKIAQCALEDTKDTIRAKRYYHM